MATPLGPLFLFFSYFFSLSFFVFVLAFYFSFFLIFCSCLQYLIFQCFSFFHFLIFSEEKVSSFLFSCVSCKYFFLLALVSEFNCFLRGRCSMEMWCPDDILGESMLQLPRVEWKLLACQNGASPDCIIVEWLCCSKRTIVVRWADLSDFFSLILVGKMCIFVSRPMKIVTFLR